MELAKEISNESLLNLVEIARHAPNLRSRIILHSSNDSNVQAMIICLLKESEVGIHRHPVNKPEYYVILKGTLNIYTLREDNFERSYSISDEPGKPKIFFTQGNIWHEPMSVTEFAIYFEVYTGPFDKVKDVEYFVR